MPRYGRILNPSKDALFSYPPPGLCAVTSGGEFLGRALDDDYARFRVPDTTCPALPEPGEPKDSGIADEAEPARWSVYGSPDTTSDWNMLESRDRIDLNYTVYPADFVLEVVSDYVSRTGTNVGDPGYLTFDGVCLVFDLAGYTFGIGAGWSKHHGIIEVPWGGSEGRAVHYFIAQGTTKVASAEWLIPNSQTDVRYRVERSGTQIRFGCLMNGTWDYSMWFAAAAGEISIKFEGVRITDGGPQV